MKFIFGKFIKILPSVSIINVLFLVYMAYYSPGYSVKYFISKTFSAYNNIPLSLSPSINYNGVSVGSLSKQLNSVCNVFIDVTHYWPVIIDYYSRMAVMFHIFPNHIFIKNTNSRKIGSACRVRYRWVAVMELLEQRNQF